MRWKSTLVAILLVVTAACGGGDDDDKGNPGNPSGGTGSGSGGGVTLSNGSMSASIDGASWNANAAIIATYTPGLFVVSGGDTSGRAIAFALIPNGTGTYTINSANNVGFNFVLNIGSAGYASPGTGSGTGSLTLTTLTPSHAVGTFSFVANPTPNTGASGNKTVTNGKLDVTY